MDAYDALSVFSMGAIGHGNSLIAHISEQTALVLRVEPHHATAAAGV